MTHRHSAAAQTELDQHEHEHERDHHPHPHPSEHSGHDHPHPHPHPHDHGRRGDGHDHPHDHDHGAGLWARVKHAVVPHSHDANEAIQTADQSSGTGIRTAWIGLAGMTATAIAQIVIVAISGSIALLADTLHNLGHAVTTIPLVIAFRLGRRPANKRYSYGYRRAEDLAGIFISLVIAASVVLIFVESIDAMVNPHPLANLGWVFAAGIVGFVGNEAVALYRMRAGKRIGSAALIAEGQHARADGLTSIAVIVGVAGVWLGFERADAIMGLLIGLAVFGILISSLRTIGRRLMDGVEPGVVDQMTEVAERVPGVIGVDRMRARWSGHRLEADANIKVPADIDILAGHRIAEDVEHTLLHNVAHLEGVVVHLHPTGACVDAEQLHELSGHHVSSQAREAYRRKLAAGRTESA